MEEVKEYVHSLMEHHLVNRKAANYSEVREVVLVEKRRTELSGGRRKLFGMYMGVMES
mgnify:CR=1 FL=1